MFYPINRSDDPFDQWIRDNRAGLLDALCRVLERAAVEAAEKAIAHWNRVHDTTAAMPADWRQRLKAWACGAAVLWLAALIRALRALVPPGGAAPKPSEIDEAARKLVAHAGEQEGAYFAHSELEATVKSWYTSHDKDVCAVCVRNEAEEFIPLGRRFPSGHLHPPAHPNCRCSLDYAGVPRHMLLRL